MFEKIKTNNNKHNKFITLITGFSLFVFIIGLSFAVYYWQFTGKKNTISTGDVSISLLEDVDSINIENALPISDTQGISLTHDSGNSGVFDFAVTTYASGEPGDITYTISITKADLDAGYSSLEDDQIKVYLVAFEGSNETQVMKPTLVSDLIDSGTTGNLTFDTDKVNYLTHIHTTANTTQTQKYRLKMWIDGNADVSDWNSSSKLQYKLKVNVNGHLVS